MHVSFCREICVIVLLSPYFHPLLLLSFLLSFLINVTSIYSHMHCLFKHIGQPHEDSGAVQPGADPCWHQMSAGATGSRTQWTGAAARFQQTQQERSLRTVSNKENGGGGGGGDSDGGQNSCWWCFSHTRKAQRFTDPLPITSQTSEQDKARAGYSEWLQSPAENYANDREARRRDCAWIPCLPGSDALRCKQVLTGKALNHIWSWKRLCHCRNHGKRPPSRFLSVAILLNFFGSAQRQDLYSFARLQKEWLIIHAT